MDSYSEENFKKSKKNLKMHEELKAKSSKDNEYLGKWIVQGESKTTTVLKFQSTSHKYAKSGLDQSERETNSKIEFSRRTTQAFRAIWNRNAK